MAEISKKDLKKKVDELDISEDNKIELLEDIEDSVKNEDTEEKVLKSEYDAVVKELEDVKRKYKERFLSGDSVIPVEKEDEELKEEKYIDVKEI
jgi:hypothetical protein